MIFVRLTDPITFKQLSFPKLGNLSGKGHADGLQQRWVNKSLYRKTLICLTRFFFIFNYLRSREAEKRKERKLPSAGSILAHPQQTEWARQKPAAQARSLPWATWTQVLELSPSASQALCGSRLEWTAEPGLKPRHTGKGTLTVLLTTRPSIC